MRKQQLYKVSMFAVLAIFTLGGCIKDKPSAPIATAPTQAETVEASTTLATLNSSGVSTLALSGTKKYKEKDTISFKVNTMGKAGYLYIIYLDNKGNTTILYPNERSPLTELSGEYTFPRDFGNMTMNAEKDCNGCSEEKTTIYAILTKEPVSDIKNITKAHLMKYSGEQPSGAQSKGMSFDIGSDSTGSDTNINVGKIEFVVN